MATRRMYSTLFVLLFAATAASAGPIVVSVTPVPQSMTAGTLTEITLQFDVPLDPSTVNNSTIMISGRWSGIPAGTFSLEDSNRVIRFVPSEALFFGEWVTVAVSRGLQAENGDPIEKGYGWNFWTAAAPGTLDQTLVKIIEVREPGEPHIQTYGAHGADLNNDGFTDLTVPNEISDDVRVFLNNGLGDYNDFTIHPVPNGDFASTNEAADLDGDGDLDFVVGNGGNDRMCVFIGDGKGGFESSASYPAGNSVRGVAVLDLEGDGDPDIVTANRSASNLSIFYNNGDGTFQPAMNIDGNGSQETACVAVDANEDGIMDLFVGAHGSGELIVLLGDGEGGLTFSSEVNAGGSPWMIAAGDVNGDGHVDVVSANSFGNNAAVALGDGAGGLLPAVTYPTGSFCLAIDLGDLDGDGDLDMMTSNYSSGDWTLYENDGTGVFVNPRTFDATNAGSCATFHDRDNDGDLDITAIDEVADQIFMFENESPTAVVPAGGEPTGFDLGQNYPNPFNPQTEIGFTLSATGQTTMRVYDLLGREVRTLVNEHLDAGTYEVTFDAADLPSGVYYYRLEQGQLGKTRKLLLAK